MSDQYGQTQENQDASQAQQSSSVEQEILELERQLNQKKAEREKTVEETIGKEKPSLAQAQSDSQIAPASVSTAATAPAKTDAISLSGLEKNQQLQGLVQLAFAKGVAHATEVVRNLDNPYLIDEFHDVLIDEFRKALIEQGKLEEI